MRAALALLVAVGDAWHRAFLAKTADEAITEFMTRGEYWIAAGYDGMGGPKATDNEAYVPSARARDVVHGSDVYSRLEAHVDACQTMEDGILAAIDQGDDASDENEPMDKPALDSKDPAAVASVIQIYKKTRLVMEQHIKEGQAAWLADASERQGPVVHRCAAQGSTGNPAEGNQGHGRPV